ncbi:gamma-glutamyl-gamma-aminobutyrate hydrolase family protein [Brachyspira pilosicoli]|uniref:gamma-glutamyl-gamma-aminobutyrate hydrolase family protein n=1 Tax=Brachyspira pilosicoli TaxID=52584 RepID=UPI0012F4EE37|nr:gamma-glutamyl-gamma-aminobutyrate hydrolase family protein [Brachyspira pilosicoli]
MKKNFIFCLLSIFILACSNANNRQTQSAETDTNVIKIGISWEREFPLTDIPEDTQVYIDSIKKVGAEPVLLPQVKNEEDALNAINMVDALVMTGGEDINPKYYNEEPHKKLETPKDDRDLSDYILLKKAIEKDFPVLATCRGMQMLNTVQGGTLYQDINSEYKTDISHRDPEFIDFTYHACYIDKDSKLHSMLNTNEIEVNSWHHQSIEKVGEGLKITAKASDNTIEGLELTNAVFVVGVQFHPEWHLAENNNEFLPIFETLKEYGKKYRESK